MKARKILVSLAALALVAAISIGGTLAYLTSTKSVTNTFTVGNVSITLDEAKLDKDGMKLLDKDDNVVTEVTKADRTNANTYKLIPGHTYTKDPTIHVGEQSEDCYLFVRVENGLSTVESTIPTQMETLGWKAVEGQTGVYVWYGKTDGTMNTTRAIVSGNTDVTVFKTFTFGDQANPTQYEKAEIVVTAYAIQADGLADENDADLWAKFPASTT